MQSKYWFFLVMSNVTMSFNYHHFSFSFGDCQQFSFSFIDSSFIIFGTYYLIFHYFMYLPKLLCDCNPFLMSITDTSNHIYLPCLSWTDAVMNKCLKVIHSLLDTIRIGHWYFSLQSLFSLTLFSLVIDTRSSIVPSNKCQNSLLYSQYSSMLTFSTLNFVLSNIFSSFSCTSDNLSTVHFSITFQIALPSVLVSPLTVHPSSSLNFSMYERGHLGDGLHHS